MTKRQDEDRQGLLRDQSGAIMVMGVFMAVLLVGFMYYMIGLGETIAYRERLQDASDAGAFSSSIMHARGMNIIALINMVMAAIMAVLVAIKLIETIAIIALALVFAFGWIPGLNFLYGLVSPLNSVRQWASNAFNNLKPTIFNILKIAKRASDVTAVAMPIAAQGRVVDTLMLKYNDVVVVGVAFPLYERLPVDDDRFELLCERAGEYVVDIVLAPIQGLGVPGIDWLKDKLRGKVGAFVGSFSQWFCGDGSGEPPSFGDKQEKQMPPPPSEADCKNDVPGACSATGEQASAQPDETTGECPAQGKDDCELRSKGAFDYCHPDTDNDIKDWYWREQEYLVTIKNDGGDLKIASITPNGSSRRENDNDAPCGGADWKGNPPDFDEPGWSTSESWSPNGDGSFNVATQRFDQPHVCDNRAELYTGLTLTGQAPPEGQTTTQQFPLKVVEAILYCTAEVEISASDASTLEVSRDANGKTGMEPKKVLDEAELGDKNFQKRVAALGDPNFENTDPGVKIATWGQDAGVGEFTNFLANLGRIGLAQAEFYYDGEEDREEWLWHMAWKGRLRRFRIVEPSEFDALQDICANRASLCSVLDQLVNLANSVIVH